MRAVVVDPGAPGRLTLNEVPEPVPGSSEVIVAVEAISLNPGELRFALGNAPAEFRPGWDLAGIVVRPAADGSGPPEGARVVGFMESGAWAQRVAIAASALAIVPPDVTLAQAATLPVAGLTALHSLQEGGLLLGSRILVTAASGGVGRFAVQLGRAAGAHVSATVRRPEAEAQAVADGAERVFVTSKVGDARDEIPYDLIIDSLGGHSITAALGMLTPGGACVVYGVADGDMAPIQISPFMRTGGARLVGFFLYQALRREPSRIGLGKLLNLVIDGRLRPEIELEAHWSDIASVAPKVLGRSLTGKAILHVGALS